ncbi:MAG: ABC transporter permease [Acidobacteria bacterium]|nr:ABC transporter permease [Acidobacteriota bacterium]
MRGCLRRLFWRIRGLTRDDGAEARHEMEHHLQEQTEHNQRRGMSPEEARRAALMESGGIEAAVEAYRDASKLVWADGMMRDARYAVRALRHTPGFTVLAVVCLGLGIGVNTSIFSLLNYMFFRPMPVAAPERLTVIGRGNTASFSYPDYRDIAQRSRAFEGIAASNATESSLDFEGMTHAAGAEAVSANYPRVIGVGTALGRWFYEDEDGVVISYHVWEQYFNRDPGVLGKRVRSETRWYTVVGVAPKAFAGTYLPIKIDIWVSAQVWARQHDAGRFLADRGRTQYFLFGRLKEGIAAGQAAAELRGILESLDREYPNARSGAVQSQPATVDVVRGVPRMAIHRQVMPVAGMLSIVALLVLLIACTNVGNLLLARCATREREISMRLALGAGRWRILRQLLTEALLLAAAGGVAGLLFAVWTNRALTAIFPDSPFDAVRIDLELDPYVFAFAGGVSLLTMLVFGLAPSWQASKADVLASLKGTAGINARSRIRRYSLMAQVTFSFVLLLTAGLLLRSLHRLQNTDPGFSVSNRYYASVYATRPEFTRESALRFYTQVTDQLRASPGVKSATVTSVLPLTPMRPGCVALPGQSTTIAATGNAIDPGYLATMGIGLPAGGTFTAAHRPGGPHVALVNESLAHRLWPEREAIGERILVGCREKTELTVIGVTRDSRFRSMGEAAGPHVYRPFAQTYEGGVQTVLVEMQPGVANVEEQLRKRILAVNPAARIYEVKPLPDWVTRSYWQVSTIARMIVAFAVLALVLAMVGLYGILAYQVTLLTPEIGLRMAVGAQPREVTWMVVRGALRDAAIGIGVGVVAALALARLMSRMLYGVSPSDPLTYVAVCLLWLAAAGGASYLPGRRGARVDPMTALRNE